MAKKFKFNPFTDQPDMVLDTVVSDARYLKLDQTTPQPIVNGPVIELSEPSFTYNVDGTLSKIEYPSGYYKEYSYNVDGTLDEIDFNGEYTKTLVWSGGVLQSIEVS